MIRAAALVLGLLAAVACGQEAAPGPTPAEDPPAAPEAAEPFTITSPAFEEGDPVPEVYSCNGDNIAPPLGWTGVPEGSVELVLLLRDPDAPGGNFFHWTAFGMDPSVSGSPEGGVPEGAEEGATSFGPAGYGGPCPPPGESHRYVFELAALDSPSGLQAGADPAEVVAVVEGAPEVATLTAVYPG